MYVVVHYANYKSPAEMSTTWYTFHGPITVNEILYSIEITEKCYVYLNKGSIITNYDTVIHNGTEITILVCHPSFNHRWGIIYKKDETENTKMFESKEEMIDEFNSVIKIKPPTVREIICGWFNIIAIPSKLISVYDIWANNIVALDECRTRIESLIRRNYLMRTNTNINRHHRKPNHSYQHQRNSNLLLLISNTETSTTHGQEEDGKTIDKQISIIAPH